MILFMRQDSGIVPSGFVYLVQGSPISTDRFEVTIRIVML